MSGELQSHGSPGICFRKLLCFAPLEFLAGVLGLTQCLRAGGRRGRYSASLRRTRLRSHDRGSVLLSPLHGSLGFRLLFFFPPLEVLTFRRGRSRCGLAHDVTSGLPRCLNGRRSRLGSGLPHCSLRRGSHRSCRSTDRGLSCVLFARVPAVPVNLPRARTAALTRCGAGRPRG